MSHNVTILPGKMIDFTQPKWGLYHEERELTTHNGILGCAFQFANSCIYIYIIIHTYPPVSSNVAMGSKWMLEYVSFSPGASSINMPRFHQFSSQVFSFPLEGGWWFPSA